MLRMYHSRLGMEMVVIRPGERWSSRTAVAIGSCLGSCVATCLTDGETGIAGMNHFLLAAPPGPSPTPADAGHFGSSAMEGLVSELLQLGASRESLRARIYGGASLPGWGETERGDIGTSNVLVAMEYLDRERIPIVAQETGGGTGRSILFNTRTGEVQVRRLRSRAFDSVLRHERRCQRALQPEAGPLTVLFQAEGARLATSKPPRWAHRPS